MYKIAVIAGGDSGEHEVSLRTADNVISQLDREKFEPYKIVLRGSDWSHEVGGKSYQIDKNDFSLEIEGTKVSFDAVFIAIHGTPGENGRLQGYFDMIGIPYTGSGSFSSALTFNKFYCNLAVNQLGVPISPSLHFYRDEEPDFELVENVCGYPCFVKSCNSGSSVGVVKVRERGELRPAFEEAFRYDNQLIVEKMVHGRELTCGVTSVYGGAKMIAVTEVVANNDFYDYDAKYTDAGHDLLTPADISPELRETLKRYSELIFRRLDCKGVARVDFMVNETNKVPYFLEINTVPGMTALSIVPDQVKHAGLDIKQFYSKLIEETLNK